MKVLLHRIAWVFVLVLSSVAASAERGDDSNRASKNGRVVGTLDGVEVTIEYGRPHVRDRQIWGGLVPYERVWRTGADEATTIVFAADVIVEGTPLPAGRYSLFTIPGQDQWTVILNNTPDQWGAFSYEETDDAVRFEVPPRSGEHVEILTFDIGDGDVVLRWAEVEVAFRVAADG